jgi:hypothetical protein
MTNLEAEDTMYNDDERAGNIGVFLTDFSNEYSQSVADENGATPTDSQSRQDTKLYLADHDGTSDYDMSSVTATSTGFQVTSANITTADTTTHLWPTILVGTSSSAAPLRRRR